LLVAELSLNDETLKAPHSFSYDCHLVFYICFTHAMS
jgi:hypothetical protein